MGGVVKTLYLTSPHMTGADVLRAQRTLNGQNTYDHDYFGGNIDGVFGPVTAQASKRVKFWLGYPDDELKPIYGEKLHNFLTGKTVLPADYKARRARRIAAQQAQPVTLGQKALKVAMTFVGKTEQPPNSNHFPGITDWYGLGNVPYCAEGVTYCYVQAGSKAFVRGSEYAYVPFLVADAQKGEDGLHVVAFGAVQPGDPVCFDWDGGVADHVGLVKEKLSPTTFRTVEFNTSPTNAGSQSNGGGCYIRERHVSQVEAFIRVTK